MSADRIVIPLDSSNAEVIRDTVRTLDAYRPVFKVGYEAGYSLGWDRAIEAVDPFGTNRVMLDVKLHDIPNTMARAAEALVEKYRPWGITVHASSGLVGMKNVVDAVGDGQRSDRGHSPLVIAVTVLTSLNERLCRSVYREPPDLAVVRLAASAYEAGCGALVCSPRDLAFIRRDEPDIYQEMVLITPGVRPVWAAHDDQVRVMTPKEAIDAGADYLVIGRPILKPPEGFGSPENALKLICEEIE